MTKLNDGIHVGDHSSGDNGGVFNGIIIDCNDTGGYNGGTGGDCCGDGGGDGSSSDLQERLEEDIEELMIEEAYVLQ